MLGPRVSLRRKKCFLDLKTGGERFAPVEKVKHTDVHGVSVEVIGLVNPNQHHRQHFLQLKLFIDRLDWWILTNIVETK